VSNTTDGRTAEPADEHGDTNRRRLTPDECRELLSRPVVGIFSSLAKHGWIHSVPVHFVYRDGEVRVLCGTNSVKATNVDRTGRATLCVEATNGTERRYVTVEGPLSVERPAQAHDVIALDEQYKRADAADWTGVGLRGRSRGGDPAHPLDRLVRLGLTVPTDG
jgi:nitroimidazol reductase NimA-like FMN-containing flavoprotein (pyridoxamine 5'-phosphate oxidase superfamily)